MSSQTLSVTPISDSQAGLRVATLKRVTATDYLLEDQGFEISAMAAYSCLVKPQAGDSVLYASDNLGRNIILSIIDRQGSQDMNIQFPENVTMSSATGSIDVSAHDSISMVSTGINLISEKSVQQSGEAYLNVSTLHASGQKLNASFDSIMLLSKLFSSIAHQAIQKFKTYIRHSEEFDQVKAANMMRSSEGVYTVDSKQTVMISEKDTKIDAERIHIG